MAGATLHCPPPVKNLNLGVESPTKRRTPHISSRCLSCGLWMQQRGSDELEQLLSLILLFMGSPEYMRNPHLRAGMAEAIETLLPPRSAPNQPSTSLLSTQWVPVFLLQENNEVPKNRAKKYVWKLYMSFQQWWANPNRDLIKIMSWAILAIWFGM